MKAPKGFKELEPNQIVKQTDCFGVFKEQSEKYGSGLTNFVGTYWPFKGHVGRRYRNVKKHLKIFRRTPTKGTT